MQKKIIIPIIIVGVIAIIGSITFYKKNNIELLSMKKGDVLEAIYGLGKVKSNQIYDVKIGIITNIKKVYVNEGDEVKKDSPLISFDSGSIFKAPFNGTVTSISFQEGEIAIPQMTILKLENMNELFIEVSLEQDAALKVQKDQKAKVLFANNNKYQFTGTVKNIFPRNGEFISNIEINNLPPNIIPGMTADVVIEVGNKKDVTLLPIKAIIDGRVIRLRNNKKEKIEVSIGNTDGEWAEITQGDIIASDLVIIKKGK